MYKRAHGIKVCLVVSAILFNFSFVILNILRNRVRSKEFCIEIYGEEVIVGCTAT
jgi:hypothetical protein